MLSSDPDLAFRPSAVSAFGSLNVSASGWSSFAAGLPGLLGARTGSALSRASYPVEWLVRTTT